jgi:hypothetical protein
MLQSHLGGQPVSLQSGVFTLVHVVTQKSCRSGSDCIDVNAYIINGVFLSRIVELSFCKLIAKVLST